MYTWLVQILKPKREVKVVTTNNDDTADVRKALGLTGDYTMIAVNVTLLQQEALRKKRFASRFPAPQPKPKASSPKERAPKIFRAPKQGRIINAKKG